MKPAASASPCQGKGPHRRSCRSLIPSPPPFWCEPVGGAAAPGCAVRVDSGGAKFHHEGNSIEIVCNSEKLEWVLDYSAFFACQRT
eukprot:COSAG02_NODE_2085_length_9885_cov_9.743946_8_plen_86_part_00